MTALVADRLTKTRSGHQLSLPAAAGVKVFAGGVVCLNATGFAVKGGGTGAVKAVGIASAQVDNTTGIDGGVQVPVERKCWQLANSAGGDLITLADYGTPCYLVDDQTVAKTNGGGTRIAAGTIRDVDVSGVWVEF